ncbi:hypothetical protein [Nitrospirillum viridazoti]|uniref:Uncharacterized protein n=1 Tax=Nitrospirillum viridazoti CBAmc TaxID=1441467 RepID=A0A248K0Q9_9PROT|nr:hypothetical protein [Nitrospirillum amazonense]ASG24346.1 hypothetical protein Y958_25995 [Nitrospirillum amazonense CBAmc]TWB33294.1 hypothetical protein FBZ91_1147 [Nitrospirillum amazonense]
MAKLQEARGVLRRRGNHTLTGGFCVYSIAEIGDRIITDLGVPNGLDAFLDECDGQELTIWFTKPFADKKQVLAIKLPDGKLYYSVPGWGGIIFFVVLALIGCLFFGLGLLLLPLIFDLVGMNFEAGQWARQGGIEIRR